MRTGSWLLLGLLAVTGSAAPPHAAIRGWWRGTSTCIKADWNAACHDEQVIYRFTPAAKDSTQSTLRAWKLVAGKPELMGDLDFAYEADSARWNGDFANGRVDIRWSYWIVRDTLMGQVVIRPGMQVGRRVVAVRGGEFHE